MGNDNVKDYPPYLDYPKPRKPITNADRIRSMTDEELAEYLSGIAESHRGCRLDCGDSCIGAWLDWLKQEVESNDS